MYKRKFRIPRYKRARVTRISAGARYKKYLKETGRLRCEICSWFDPTIQPFYMLEVHHIKRVCDGGGHEYPNLIVCCPNHHNLMDRISKKHRDTVLTKDVVIALVKEHEHNRRRWL